MKRKDQAWKHKSVSDFTLEDILEAHEKGVYAVCGDGRIKFMTNDEGAV